MLEHAVLCRWPLRRFSWVWRDIPSMGDQPKEHFRKDSKTVREHWYQTVQCTWIWLDFLWPKLGQLAGVRSPRELVLYRSLLQGPMKKKAREAGRSSG